MRILLGLAVLVACHHSDGGGAVDAPAGDGATSDGAHDAPIIDGSDGTPVRQACTNNYGTALTQTFGRLDGFLVAIVQPGASGCNGDSDHIHLQIRANAEIYDIAVDVGAASGGSADVHTTTRAMTFPAWAEGWHTTGELDDYVTDGVHSTDLPLESRDMITADVNADLATVNHISVFATGYGSDGAHLVHRNGGGHDGLIVTQPLSSPSHARLFSFSTQTF